MSHFICGNKNVVFLNFSLLRAPGYAGLVYGHLKIPLNVMTPVQEALTTIRKIPLIKKDSSIDG